MAIRVISSCSFDDHFPMSLTLNHPVPLSSKLKRKLIDDATNTRLLDGEATSSSTTRSVSLSSDQMTYDDVQSVAHHLLHRTKIRPEVGIICGSGLGELAEDLDKDNDTDVFPYKDIPNFPTTTGV